jgi:acyl carrier protein
MTGHATANRETAGPLLGDASVYDTDEDRSEKSIALRVRRVAAQCAQLGVDLDSLRDEDSLYEAGMSSRASVNLMLGLEGEFDVEFPDRLLRRDVFESIASIASAIESLLRS